MIDPNDPNCRPKDYRMLGIVLCLAAIVLFGYASFSHRWLENTHVSRTLDPERIGFSLIAFEACTGDRCETTSTFKLIDELRKRTGRHDEPPSGAFAPAGVATMALQLLAILALGATAVLAYKRKRLTISILPTTIALLAIMTALIAGCMFVAKKPGGYGAVGVGPSFWAFAIACVVGIVGAQLLNKLVKPLDPVLDAA